MLPSGWRLSCTASGKCSFNEHMPCLAQLYSANPKKNLAQKKLTRRACSTGFKRRFEDLLEYDPEEEIARFKVTWNSDHLSSRHFSNVVKDYRAQLAPLVVDQLPLLISTQKSKLPILVEGANAIMVRPIHEETNSLSFAD